MSLELDFLEMLRDREKDKGVTSIPGLKTTTATTQAFDPAVAFDPTGIEGPELKGTDGDRAVVWDVLGSALWSFTNEALFGLPGAAYKRQTGDEFWTPETVPGRVAAGVGGFAGFAAPLPFSPLRVGSKIATGLAGTGIRMAGKNTVKSSTRKAVGEVVQQTSSKGAKLFAQQIGKASGSWVNMARWDTKVATNWEKFASKNIDDLVAMGVQTGKVSAKSGKIIKEVFKKNFKDRPMIDIIDVVMRNRPTQAGFAMGSMLHEAVMFGAIDSIIEGVHLWGEKKSYEEFDWTHTLWGAGTGAAFGALKFMPGHGKVANTWKDFKSGWSSWARRPVFDKMNKSKLMENVKILGNELKNGGNGKSSYIVEYMHKGKSKTLDMTNPETYLTGFKDDTAEKILKEVITRKQREIGKLMMKEAIWEDMRSSMLNKKHMVLGTIIMNARNILAISRGEDVPLEDFLTSVFLGAFVNRKGGGGKTYDIMQNEMMSLRRSLEVFGHPSANYVDRFPSGAQGSMNRLNPLNYGEFNKVREIFRKSGLTSDDPAMVEFMNADGSKSVTAATATAGGDFSLFNHAYSFIHGASGERHIKSRDKVTEKEARAIEKALGEVEYRIENESFQLNTVSNLNRLHDRVESETIHLIQDIMQGGGLVYYKDGKPNTFPIAGFGLENIGAIPERVKISDALYTKAEKGEVTWLVDKKGEILRGEEARFRLTEYQKKLDAAFEFMQWLPGRSEYYKGERGAGYIESSDKLGKVVESLLNKENVFNSGFKINKPWLEFKIEHLEEMALPVAMRYFNKKQDQISELFDINGKEWNSILDAVRSSGLIVNSADGLKNAIIQNPNKNIELKIPKDMQAGDPRINEYKQFLANISAILGAKGQMEISETGKTAPSTQSVDNLVNLLNSKGLTKDIKIFNMFAQDVVSRIAYEKVQGTKLTNGDVYMLQELMSLPIPMAKYGVSGTAYGFQVKKLKKSSSMDKDLQSAIDEYNLEIDGLVRRGQKEVGDGNVIKVIDESPLITELHSIKSMTEMLKRARSKSDESALDHIVDFMNALDPNDSLRNSLGNYMNKYGVSADRLFHWLRTKAIIEPVSGKRASVPKYKILTDKIKEGSPLRAELDNWLSIEYGLKIKDVEHLRVTAEQEANDLIEQSNRDIKSNQTITVDGFFKKWFPTFTTGGKPFGSRVKDYDGYLNDRLFNTINHGINEKAVNEIISDMEFIDNKTGDRTSGKDIMKGWDANPRNRVRYYEAVGDIMHIMKTRLTTTVKGKIQYGDS